MTFNINWSIAFLLVAIYLKTDSPTVASVFFWAAIVNMGILQIIAGYILSEKRKEKIKSG